MNELNKLIKRYEQENPGMRARTNTVGDGSIWYDGFVEWLANRPTCPTELKRCTGCDCLNITPITPFALACCPDNHYISVSVCGVEQRKFLDEIEKRGRYSDNFKRLYLIYEDNDPYSSDAIKQSRFTADLKKVIKGE